jgi:hypothetical protein
MESQDTATPTKQITVEVPEDRVAEFYAFTARFLARGRRRPHRGHHGHHGHHGCRGRHAEREAADRTAATDV